MATKGTVINPYFFIFDFYLMNGASDSNDIVPMAILYFYPPDDEIRHQKITTCSHIVGVVQYFQHDLFRSVARRFYFQKSFIAHQYYGRHSAFLSLPDDKYTSEEGSIYLKHILNLFNMLYGTWDHIQSKYKNEDQIKDFLNQTLTPIINYVLNQHRSLTNLFSIIEYMQLKSDNQRILLDSKHYLGHLKSEYGLHNGFIAYEDKILYTTCDSDTTFYLQILYLLRHELPENLMTISKELKFQLSTGVSLYRIYIPQPPISDPIIKTPATVKAINKNAPKFTITTEPVNMSTNEESLVSSYSKSQPHRLSVPSSSINKRHPSLLTFRDQYCSSEETGFDTDTMDEMSPLSNNDVMSTSSLSMDENMNDLNTEDSDSASADEENKSDEQKLEKKQSRSSTIDEREFGDTIEQDRTICFTNSSDNKPSVDGPIVRIHITQIPRIDTDDDDEEAFRYFHRQRTRTVTTNSDSTKDVHKNDVHVNWTNIPDKNIEQERDQFVLYIQKNSGMIFVGIFEENLLTDDYLNKLWNLMISQLADMEAAIHVIPTSNEIIRLTSDVKFDFNENTHYVKFQRVYDGLRYSRRIPNEDGIYMAHFARSELNRSPKRTVIGLSRGSLFVSIDRSLPDRIKCSCGRSQETL